MTIKQRPPKRTISPHVKIDSPAYRVIAIFGGFARFCEACGYAVSTAHGWLVKGLIPAKYQAHILAVAAEKGIELPPEMFVPPAAVA